MTPDSNPRFSIVLPCYNEAGSLPALFGRFSEVLKGRDDVEVIFVDNGSTDRSQEVLQREQSMPGRGYAHIVTVPFNQGYGYGILTGLRQARGQFVGWTHADSQYDPVIVVAGFELLAHSPHPERTFVQGRRVKRNLFDSVFTASMSVVSSLCLGVFVRDINAQPKLFPSTFLRLLERAPRDFSLDLYALYRARKAEFQIHYLPVEFGRRLHGEAKGGGSFRLKWKLTKRTWSFIKELRREIKF